MNYLKIILLAFFVSFLLSFLILKNYKTDKVIINNENKTYLLTLNEYDNYDLMYEDTKNLSKYVYECSDKCYVYIGMTKKLKNLEKIKGIFEENGYSIYVREVVLEDKFNNIIDNYDKLIEQDYDILKLQNNLLEEYEEYYEDKGTTN